MTAEARLLKARDRYERARKWVASASRGYRTAAAIELRAALHQLIRLEVRS